MNYKLQVPKNLRHIGVMLLVFVTTFFTSAAASPTPYQRPIKNTQASQAAIDKYLATQQDADLSDEEKIKAAIDAYFTTRYEGQKSIAEQDFSALIEDDTLDWVKKEKDKREIELYIASLFDLGYESYKFTLEYDTIEIKGNKATVQLRESHEVVFNSFSPDVSKLANLPHTITLHSEKGVWKVFEDNYSDEYSKLLEYKTKEEIKKQADDNFNNFDNKASDQQRLSQPEGLASISYNRNAAVTYANNYWQNYNTTWYNTNPGTDCANFVSQSLYAGSGYTPPNTSAMGSYGDDYNTSWYYDFPTRSGSLPWLRVQEQFTFITQNSVIKNGPRGWGGEGYLCSTQIGDVVQLFGVNFPYNTWDHEGIIVYANGPCGSLSSYKVNAHTTNRYQYPLSNWGGYPMRFIMISGFNPYSFTDVTRSHWAWMEIERLFENHITGGCSTNPLRYCPENTVTRAEMAVFLLRGIHGYSYIPPAVYGTRFVDVSDSYWAADWIEQLAAENITGGCAIGYYCPNNNVTHAQMAVFLLRSKHGASYVPPSVYGTRFADVPDSHWAADWIEQLAYEGVSYGAHGCTTGYCPEYAVTRAEMAGMLLRAFNLP